MASKITLHIGASKTGSSAIQGFIRRNVDLLRMQGFVVPDRELGLTSRVTGEHVMGIQSYMNNQDKAGLEDRFAEMTAEIGEDQQLLLSAENMGNMGSHKFFDTIGEKYDARAILYIRRQDDLLASAWQQWHSKIEPELNAWLIKGLRTYGHWDRIINDWEGVLGEGRVTVRVFQRDAMVGGDLFQDFMDALGLDPKTPGLDTNIGQVNPSYSDIITPLVSNNPAIFRDSHDNDFYKAVGDLTGSSYIESRKVSLLTADQRESLIFYYRDINQRVCKKYFPGRPQLFAALDHSKYEYLTPEEVQRRQLRFLAEMIYKSHVAKG